MQFPELLLSPFASLERIFSGWEFVVRLQHGKECCHLWQWCLAQGWRTHQVCGELRCSVAHHTSKLDKATGPVDGQAGLTGPVMPSISESETSLFKGTGWRSPLFQHIHPSLPVSIMPLTQFGAGGNYSRLPAGDSLGKCNAGLESSRVVFPGPGSTARGHCQNTAGVSLQLWRETS